jgi:hypothetical protein
MLQRVKEIRRSEQIEKLFVCFKFKMKTFLPEEFPNSVDVLIIHAQPRGGLYDLL